MNATAQVTPTNGVNPQGRQRMMSARMRAREYCPYFARGLARLIPFETKAIPTLAVDTNWRFYWNSDFAASQTVDELAMELIHELCHVLRFHGKRREAIHAEPGIWNVAGDAEINDDLQEMSTLFAKAKSKAIEQVPHLPDFCIMPGRGPLAHLPAGWMAEQYYVRLREQQKQGGQGQGQQGGGQGGQGTPQPSKDPGTGGSPGQGSGSGGRKRPSQANPGGGGSAPSQTGSGSPISHPGPPQVGSGACGSGAGGHASAAEEQAKAEAEGAGVPGLSEVEQAHARKQVAKDIIEAGKNSVTRGTIPGGWARWANDQIAPPKIPWQQKLQRSARGAVSIVAGAILHKYTKPSRRQAGIGYGPMRPILPALVGVMPRVAVLADTSGSMGKAEMMAVIREAKGILAATNCQLTFCAVDADVHALEEVHDWRKLGGLYKGGGGTDMRPGIKALMERKRKPHVIICITDGHIGDAGPEPLGVKFIWCTVGSSRRKERPATWGEHIDIPPDEVVTTDDLWRAA